MLQPAGATHAAPSSGRASWETRRRALGAAPRGKLGEPPAAAVYPSAGGRSGAQPGGGGGAATQRRERSNTGTKVTTDSGGRGRY